MRVATSDRRMNIASRALAGKAWLPRRRHPATRWSVSFVHTTVNDDAPTDVLYVSLAARVAELGLCSQHKAHAILNKCADKRDANLKDLKQVIYLRGEPVWNPTASVSQDETDIEIQSGMPIRLSKRMSELGMCSRREAAAILRACEFSNAQCLKSRKEVIYLRGKLVTEGAAVKVPPEEKHVEIRRGSMPNAKEASQDFVFVPYADRPWDEIKGDLAIQRSAIVSRMTKCSILLAPHCPIQAIPSC